MIPKKWQEQLFRPVDIASIALFRVAFGAIMLWEVLRYFQYGWIRQYWIKPHFYFTFSGFDWISPWAGNGMYIHFFCLGVLAIFILLGFMYRLVTVLFFLGFTYVFLLDQSNYLNHFYLISLLSFLMIFIPAHRNFSLDALLFPKIKTDVIPAWPVWLLRIQLGIAYFYGGIAKINGDWLQGEPMRMWLGDTTDFPVVGSYFTTEFAAYFFSYSGLLLDLLIVPFLLWRRTRIFAFIGITLFHLTNAELFQIGIFPWFMIAATTIYFDADWIRKILHRWSSNWSFPKQVTLPNYLLKPTYSSLFTYGFGLYLLWQLLFPFRHLLIPGNVNWTEEGHNFSWHMKLRDKTANATFFVKNLDTGKEKKIKPKTYLTNRQRRKMRTRPYMIYQFAHYLKEVYRRKGQPNVSVRAVINCSLNGRKKQLLVDPHTDLSAIPKYTMPATWINPLHYELHEKRE